MVVLFVTSVIVFTGVYAIGDPLEILLPADATMAERAQVARSLGLDQPLIVQYGRFLMNALSGNLGTSFVYNRPSISIILDRLPATLELAFSALVLAIIIGIPLGLWSGLR